MCTIVTIVSNISINLGQYNFSSDEVTALIDEYPENSTTNEKLSFAPGEGKVPTNIIQEKNWEPKTFPGLFPDGKNSLDTERKTKLSAQSYFGQRIMNFDNRFALNAQYLFAATSFIEQLQIQRNINISFLRGKKILNSNNIATYHLEDGFNVFENIKNTPRYWKKMRFVQYS